MTKKQKPPIHNFFSAEGANGGCFIEIEDGEKPQHVRLRVGWSCVIVHDDEIPVSWLSELVAIATAHKDGIVGYLKEHGEGGDVGSYALMCDPPKESIK